jgi:hypothetical protein
LCSKEKVLAKQKSQARELMAWAQSEFREESGTNRQTASFGVREAAGESPPFFFSVA